MITIVKFAIRHKPSGHYLPEPTGRMGRGGSYVEPVKPVAGLLSTYPRMFLTERSAANALTQWLRGKHTMLHGWEQDGWETPAYKVEMGVTVEAVAGRVREDMEVVEILIHL